MNRAQTAAAQRKSPLRKTFWNVPGIHFSGFLDGYSSYNANRPSNSANGQTNDLYNFNDKTDQFNLSAAGLTAVHDPDPVGAQIDLLAGRANDLIHSSGNPSTADYIEQAFVSIKPRRAHGMEMDLGQFVTSAGAEVIPAMNNWNYSRSLLFTWAIPYYHFGIRTSMPVTKDWVPGLQIVNGWNDISHNNGGVTIGLTSTFTRRLYAWNVNVYTGPERSDGKQAYRNLIDTTVLLTPSQKIHAYLNYDYGQNRGSATINSSTSEAVMVPSRSTHWQGVAAAVHDPITAKAAVAARYEYFDDNQGSETGERQAIQESTVTYEYKWMRGLLSRVEYRRDWSTFAYFHKGNAARVNAQSTLTVALIAFFGIQATQP